MSKLVSQQIKGEWWLPGSDHLVAVAGILYIHGNGDNYLELQGSLFTKHDMFIIEVC